MTNDDNLTTPPEGSPTWIAELRRRCPTPEETDALCDVAERFAAIERRVLWRTEDMPEWAVIWAKSTSGNYCWWLSANTAYVTDRMPAGAPDYRPEEPGPIWLPILDPEG